MRGFCGYRGLNPRKASFLSDPVRASVTIQRIATVGATGELVAVSAVDAMCTATMPNSMFQNHPKSNIEPL